MSLESARTWFLDPLKGYAKDALEAAKQCDVATAVEAVGWLTALAALSRRDLEENVKGGIYTRDIAETVDDEITRLVRSTIDEVAKLLSRCVCRK